MKNYQNNPNAIAIRGMFEECPTLNEFFNMEEYIEERVEAANQAYRERLLNGEPAGPNLREEILETIVLYDLKIKKAEIEQYV
jgi:hypothetical protein